MLGQFLQMITHMAWLPWAKLLFWIIVCCDYRCHCRSADGSPPDGFPEVFPPRRVLRGSVAQDLSYLDLLASQKHVPQSFTGIDGGPSTASHFSSSVRPWSYIAATWSLVLDSVHTTMHDLVIFTGKVFSNLTISQTFSHSYSC